MKWPLGNNGATYLRCISDTVHTVQYSDSQCTVQVYTQLPPRQPPTSRSLSTLVLFCIQDIEHVKCGILKKKKVKNRPFLGVWYAPFPFTWAAPVGAFSETIEEISFDAYNKNKSQITYPRLRIFRKKIRCILSFQAIYMGRNFISQQFELLNGHFSSSLSALCTFFFKSMELFD